VLHLPELVFHAAPHATQVDPDYAVPFFAYTFCCVREMRHDSCIVKCSIELTGLSDPAVHHGRHLCIVTHVTADGDGPMTGGNEFVGLRLHARAVASPVPEAAPVTSATLFSKERQIHEFPSLPLIHKSRCQ